MDFTTTNARLVKSGIDDIIDLAGKANAPLWKQFVKGSKSVNGQKYIKVDSVSYLGYMPAMNEGATHTIDSMDTPFNMEVTPQQYGLGGLFTELAMKTDYYGKLAMFGAALARSRFDTEEAVAVNLLNLGFTAPGSGGTKTLDNVALFSAAHPVHVGTQSNLNTSLALSQANLETAVAAARLRKNHRGIPRQYMGELKLIVPPALEYLAKRLTNSALIPGSANNDTNVMRGMEVLVHPFLTSTTSWFLCAQDPSMNALYRLQGAIPDYSEQEMIKDPRAVKYTNGSLYTFYAGDWRGIHGCQA
jgi:hypothetical protein